MNAHATKLTDERAFQGEDYYPKVPIPYNIQAVYLRWDLHVRRFELKLALIAHHESVADSCCHYINS